MSANGNGGYYAPLKQMLSDSESEDQKENVMHIKESDSYNNLDYNSGLQSPKNYSASDIDEFNTNLNTLETTMDNVSFIQSDVSTKISFPRRCAFITSILLCVFTVLIFLWGIPCSETGSCTNNEWHDRSTTWELPYDEIELSGAIQVVDGAIPNTKNLIFIYRGNHMRHEDKSNNNNVNGVLLLVGSSGKVGWYTRENRIPTKIDCDLIDVNRDKQKDCIVSGSEGFLAALNPLSGTYYWYIHKNASNVAAIDFPIVIKDMNKDKVFDLLTVATVYPSANHNSFLIISGATGNIIGEPMTIHDCLTVKQLSETDAFTYICKNGPSEAVRQITYADIYGKLWKSDQTVNHIKKVPVASKKINLSLKKNIGNTRDVFTNGPGKFYVENSGECPDSCKLNLTLQLERNNATNVSWEYIANHVYAMKPSLFVFEPTNDDSIRGFVLKLSQWNSAHEKSSLKVDEVRYNVQNQSPKNPYDVFYNRQTINITSITPFVKYANFTAHDISERIVIVTFDKFQTHCVNVSQTDIVQICARGTIDPHAPLPLCQPDLEYQEQSLTIADLDGDESHELISYHSTFVAPEPYNKKKTNPYEDWHLTSVVKVIRLESELPKLFVPDI